MALKNSTIDNHELFATEFTNRWTKFLDALRHEDQLVLDEMFKAVDVHRDAIASMDGNAFDKKFMAMMIEQRKLDDEVERRLLALEEKIRASG